MHPELLGDFQEEAAERGDEFWQERYSDINAAERYLAHNDIIVIKLFLHVSKDEQKRRLESRLDDPSKQWKFSYVIPADRKWYARLAVAAIIVRHLENLDPQYPTLSAQMQTDLARAKAAIEAEPA